MSAERIRFTKGRTCPVCGGSEDDPRGQGTRCHGYLSDGWVHCSREEHAGKAKFHDASNTWAHKAQGKCPCGIEHAPDPQAQIPRKKKAKLGDPERIYQYRDADGEILFEALRYRLPDGDKTFRQRRKVDGKLVWNLKGVEPVLYRLPELLAAGEDAPVWIVEGEKDVDRLRSLGLVATCNPMGALKWRSSFSDVLEGRTCYIIADNDNEGRKHAQLVARSLSEAAGVKVIELPGLLEHGDVSDWLDGGGKLDQLLAIVNEAPEWVPQAEESKPAEKGKEDSKEPAKEFLSHADILLRIGAKAELFRTPQGDAYASIEANGRVEHHPVTSQAFEDWLVVQFLTECDRAPSVDSLKTALSTLKAKARFSKTERPVGIRVAADPAASDPSCPVYYLDLADDAGRAVRISAAGWQVVTDAPVKFRRPKRIAPLPVPQKGGELELLRPYVNVLDADWILLIASLTHDFLPVSPQPIKVLSGEQGSAKSTTTEVLKACVDPRHPMLGSPPQDVRDLVIIAENTWVVAFDNLSSVRPWMSDMLCRISTGGGFETRTLCTNDELTTFEACRPIIINGIDDLVSRLDLLSRAVILNCPTLEEDARRPEDELRAAFKQDHPRILGALLNAVVGGLRQLPVLEKFRLPRLASFARWGEAVSRHLGWEPGEFLETFEGNQQSASAELLEDSPLVAELTSLGRMFPAFSGTAQELLELLCEHASPANRTNPRWPRGARSLACQLRRLAPGLRRCGVDVSFATRLAYSRLIHIAWSTPPSPPAVGNFASSASSASSDGGRPSYLGSTQANGKSKVPF